MVRYLFNLHSPFFFFKYALLILPLKQKFMGSLNCDQGRIQDYLCEGGAEFVFLSKGLKTIELTGPP